MKPVSVPTKTRPETTDGCPNAETPLGNPNAHLRLRRGTSETVSSAAFADWNLVLPASGLQPFQPEPAAGAAIGGFTEHWLGMLLASPACELPTGRPLIN